MKLLYTLLPSAALALAKSQIPLNPHRLNNLDGIPLLGFGTWNLKENCTEAVSWAIQTGYRHIDAAAIYGNEKMVGRGIADGLDKSGLNREDIWVTSKLWNDHHDPTLVETALENTLRDLGLDYLDSYLMHWPVAKSASMGNSISYLTTWEAMTHLLSTDRVAHIGVSNFDLEQLEQLLAHTTIAPQIHQMELHPYLQQDAFVAWHQARGIHVTGYSPLAGTNPTYKPGDPPNLLVNPVMEKIAEKRNCTTAQVALAWGMHRGTSVIPKTSHLDRVESNFLAPGCELKKKDIKKIDKLGKARQRYNNPRESWGVDIYKGLEDGSGLHEKYSYEE